MRSIICISFFSTLLLGLSASPYFLYSYAKENALISGVAVSEADLQRLGNARSRNLMKIEPIKKFDSLVDQGQLDYSLITVKKLKTYKKITEDRSSSERETNFRDVDSSKVTRSRAFLGNNKLKKGTEKKSVIGSDDRVRILVSDKYPFTSIGLLEIQDSTGSSTCSGTLISPYAVLTAAHCIYDVETKEHARSVKFYPAINGGYPPFGYFEAKNFAIPGEYINVGLTYYSYSHVKYDLAVVTLNVPVGRTLGWLSFGYNKVSNSFIGNIVGYPADKLPDNSMWRASCDIDDTQEIEVYAYKCDTYGGSSGSAVYDYEKSDTSRIVFGVNVAGDSESVPEEQRKNYAKKISKSVYEWIKVAMQRGRDEI